MTEWKPIETCPKDQDVLLFNELWAATFGAIQIGQIDYGGWNFQSEMNIADEAGDDYDPTHWMPLPSAPAPI